MKVLELFAGTRSIGKAFESRGHEVFSIEWDRDFENIDLYEDINNITAEDILYKFGKPDVIWASPDCSTFSVAAISKHRRKNKETGSLDPVSDYAKFCDEVDIHVLYLIEALKPTFYFIENPRGGMRKMSWMQELPRYTVTYCQYGERRMKPTDIWTNHPDPQFKPPCKNGDTCHDAAPRGSQTGTQALKNAKEKGVIPEALCQHIVDICEKYIEREEKEMELKISEIKLPEQISFNYEELKTELAERISKYETLVYNETEIKTAKADRSNLNKLKKALNDERIRQEKEYMKPFNTFKAQINEIIAMIDKPILMIDGQVKNFEERKREEKLEEILHIWNEANIFEWLHPKKVLDEKWLNASFNIKKVHEEIVAKIQQISADLETLAKMPEFSFEAIEVYKDTLDINRAIQEGQKMADLQKRKAEAVEEVPQTPIQETEKAEKEPSEVSKQWIGFRALLSIPEAKELANFFKSRGIQYEPITSQGKGA